MNEHTEGRPSINIEVDHPMQVKERVLEYQLREANLEIVRLKRKCGEPITIDDIMGTRGPNSFNIVRSKKYV